MIGQQWMYIKLIGSHHRGWLAGNTDWLVHVVSLICASVLAFLLVIYSYILWMKYSSRHREKVKTVLMQELLSEDSVLQQYLGQGEVKADLLNMSGDQQSVLRLTVIATACSRSGRARDSANSSVILASLWKFIPVGSEVGKVE